MRVLVNLGKVLDEALTEFRGKTVAEVATVAHSTYSAALTLQMPTLTAPPAAAPVRRQRRAKKKPSKAAKATKTATKATAKSDDKTVSIMDVLRKAKKPIPASEISEKTGIPGQGLGPTLNMMFGNGDIVKKEIDGVKVWGPKSLNGKAHHAPN